MAEYGGYGGLFDCLTRETFFTLKLFQGIFALSKNTVNIRVCVCVCARVRACACPVIFESLGPHSPPGSSVHGIFQARILEWVTFPSSREFFLIQGLNLSLVSPTLISKFFTYLF